MPENWVEVTKTTTPLSDLMKELDTLFELTDYRGFQDGESKKLIERCIEVIKEKIKKEMNHIIFQWEMNSK